MNEKKCDSWFLPCHTPLNFERGKPIRVNSKEIVSNPIQIKEYSKLHEMNYKVLMDRLRGGLVISFDQRLFGLGWTASQ